MERIGVQRSRRCPENSHVSCPLFRVLEAWGLSGAEGLGEDALALRELILRQIFLFANSQACPLPQFGIWATKSYSPLPSPSWRHGSHCLYVICSPAAQSSPCGPAAPPVLPQSCYWIRICMLVRSPVIHMLSEVGTLVVYISPPVCNWALGDARK